MPTTSQTRKRTDQMARTTDPAPPPVVEVSPETIKELNAAVGKYYDLLKAGRGVGSPEGDLAAKELADVVGKLAYDSEIERWTERE